MPTHLVLLRLLVLLLVAAGLLLLGLWIAVVAMPGSSHKGALPPLSDEERAVAACLRADVARLAGGLPERNLGLRHNGQLAAAADFIEAELTAAGLPTERQGFAVGQAECHNLVAELRGRSRPDDVLVVGAHYDAPSGSPGANDNASGVAALLALARRTAKTQPAATLRFVAFVNEEPPYFQTPQMGSLVYARRCKQRGERIVGMLSLETIGYYSDAPGSQRYPPLMRLFYPSRGDFIAFVGNLRSRAFVRRCVGLFRRTTQFPSSGAALPGVIPEAGWSDHWSFWQQGYPALMVTDTAPFRYPWYHDADDTPDKLDYARTARVVMGLERVIRALGGVGAE